MPNIRSEINDHKKKKNPTTQAHRATQIMQLLVKEDWTMNGSCAKCSVSKKEQER